MTELSAQMQRLVDVLLGTWSITEHVPGAAIPRTGEETWHVGPGGAIIEEYRSAGESGEFHGYGVIWWDDEAKGFQALWCDSSSGCRLLTELGRWDGDRFVLGDARDIDGKKDIFRETFSDFRPTSFTQTLETGPSRDKLTTVLTIRATRIGP